MRLLPSSLSSTPAPVKRAFYWRLNWPLSMLVCFLFSFCRFCSCRRRFSRYCRGVALTVVLPFPSPLPLYCGTQTVIPSPPWRTSDLLSSPPAPNSAPTPRAGEGDHGRCTAGFQTPSTLSLYYCLRFDASPLAKSCTHL